MKKIIILTCLLFIGCKKTVQTNCHAYKIGSFNMFGYDREYYFEDQCSQLRFKLAKISGVSIANAIDGGYGVGICFTEMAGQAAIDSVDTVIFNEMSCK